MYISNSSAFNMRIKVTIFTRPLKGSNETEVSFSPTSPYSGPEIGGNVSDRLPEGKIYRDNSR